MCGRYASARTTTDLAALLGASDETGESLAEPDYNVAPTKPVPAALVRHDERRLVDLRWGLVPSWAKDPSIRSRLINARMEPAVGGALSAVPVSTEVNDVRHNGPQLRERVEVG